MLRTHSGEHQIDGGVRDIASRKEPAGVLPTIPFRCESGLCEAAAPRASTHCAGEAEPQRPAVLIGIVDDAIAARSWTRATSGQKLSGITACAGAPALSAKNIAGRDRRH